MVRTARGRLERIEQLITDAHPADGGDLPILIRVDPRFFGDNPKDPLNDMPAHICPVENGGGECGICKQWGAR